MITFLILPLSCHLHTSTSRLAPILPRRLADHHLRPYPTLLHHYPTYATTRPSTLPLPPDSSGCQLYPYLSPPITLAPAPALALALVLPTPTYVPTHPYPTTALWQSFPTYVIRLISPIRPIGPITPIPL